MTTTAMIEVSGLTKAFAGGTLAVGGLDLSFEAGGRHAVIGPNGAGKTTLLNLISGELPPTSGRIRYDGRDVTRTTRAKRSRLGIAPHLPAADGVEHAVGRGQHRAGRLAALRPARASGADAATAPVRLLPSTTWRPPASPPSPTARPARWPTASAACWTSAWPWRPIRACCCSTSPRPGLTDQGVERLLRRCARCPEEVTVVVVEHDFAFVSAIADTVTVLQDGRLLATGTPAQIAADAAVRAGVSGGVGARVGTGVRAGRRRAARPSGDLGTGGLGTDVIEEDRLMLSLRLPERRLRRRHRAARPGPGDPRRLGARRGRPQRRRQDHPDPHRLRPGPGLLGPGGAGRRRRHPAARAPPRALRRRPGPAGPQGVPRA